MAGDWIKMRSDLFTHPKVVRMASALKADSLRTVGGLMSAWCLFDAHSTDGTLGGYSPETLDDHLRWPGFAHAMIDVRWLYDDDESLTLPDFDTHNGVSAKRRAQDADRKRKVRKVSASEPDTLRTRGEKRREELGNQSSTPPPVEPAAPADKVGSFEGHELPVETPNPAARHAVAMNHAGFKCTSYTPDLVEAVREGVTVEHLLEAAAMPECTGKPATYVIRIARREKKEIARPVVAGTGRPVGQTIGALNDLEEMKRGLASDRDSKRLPTTDHHRLGSPAGS